MTLDLRSSPRVRPPIPIRVQSQSNGRSSACRDIRKMALAWLAAGQPQKRGGSVRVLSDEWGEVEPFEFEEDCRWARVGGSTQTASAGFMITQISDAGFISVAVGFKLFARSLLRNR